MVVGVVTPRSPCRLEVGEGTESSILSMRSKIMPTVIDIDVGGRRGSITQHRDLLRLMVGDLEASRPSSRLRADREADFEVLQRLGSCRRTSRSRARTWNRHRHCPVNRSGVELAVGDGDHGDLDDAVAGIHHGRRRRGD